MIVIADTGPVNYLILIGEIEVLPTLYGCVLVSRSVCDELKQPRAAEAVRAWIGRLPTRLEVRAQQISRCTTSPPRRRRTRRHSAGGGIETDQLIIGEIRGHRDANRRLLPFTRTLGFWRPQPISGCWDLKSAPDRLCRTTFHIAEDILDRLIEDQS